ncbi:MAG: hypothetical protein AABZ18_03190, partial [Pseudomonadota bacterium]
YFTCHLHIDHDINVLGSTSCISVAIRPGNLYGERIGMGSYVLYLYAHFNLLSAFPALGADIAHNRYSVPCHDLDISVAILARGARLLERSSI